MRNFLKAILIIIAVVLCFSACSKGDDDVPEGLQVVKVSETGGYKFFGPEDWVVSNDSDIAATYVSVSGKVMASITFTEGEMPSESLEEYFESQKSLFAYDITLKETPKITLGNASGETYAAIYTFKYGDADYACMQIFAKHGDAFYIFTYTAEGDPASEDSYYQKYVESARLSAESVKFTDKTPAAAGDGYEVGADGYKLVSDMETAGFELYVPGKYTVVSSDAHVSAKISDGANIFLSKATDTNVLVLDYIKMRKTELMKFAENVTDIKISLKTEYDPESSAFDGWNEIMDTMPAIDENMCFGNLDDNLIISYEYTYDVAGITYHVYQILGVNSGIFNTGIGAAGYVFTYTATEEEYYNNIDEIQTILQRIKF